MSKELPTELKCTNKVEKRWKQGQVTQEKHRAVVPLGRNEVRKNKADPELKLAKGNRKGVYKYVNSKRETRENMGPLLNRAGDQVTNHTEEAKVLNAFFVSVFTDKTDLQESQAPEIKGKVCSKEDYPQRKKTRIRST